MAIHDSNLLLRKRYLINFLLIKDGDSFIVRGSVK